MSRTTRVAALLGALTLTLSGVVAVTPPAAAGPVAPADVTWSPLAPRPNGDGYPATHAPIRPTKTVLLGDGDVAFFDLDTKTIRRIDSTTGVITSVAGDGKFTNVCPNDLVGQTAAGKGIPNPISMASDGAGHLYLLGSGWCQPGAVLRLEDDGTWRRVVVDPAACCGLNSFSALAVAPDGTVYVYDSVKNVVRRYLSTDAPDSPGTVIAGTAGIAGTSGDGGPATSATLSAPRRMVVRGTGLFLTAAVQWAADGDTAVRRVDLVTGQIARIAGTGAPTPVGSAPGPVGIAPGPHPAVGSPATTSAMTISSMDVSADGTQVVLGLARVGYPPNVRALDLVTFPVGGIVSDVRHTAVADGGCESDDLMVLSAPARVATCVYDLRTWALDGTQSTASGAILAGLDSRTGRVSPDGVPWENLYPGSILDLATSSTGAVALAASGGLRFATSLAPVAPVTRLGTGPAWAATFTSGNTIAWSEGDTDAVVRRWAPGDTSPTIVAGGGLAPLTDGAPATSVSLPRVTGLAATPDGDLVLGVESGVQDMTYADHHYLQVWSVDQSTGVIHLIAGNGDGFAQIVPGDAATAAPLGRVAGIAVDAGTGRLWVADDGLLIGIDGGVVTSLEPFPQTRDLSARPDGTLLLGLSIRAADGTWSQVAQANYAQTAFMPDGSVLAARDDASILQRSGAFTVPTGAGTSATMSLEPGEGTLLVTVNPPAVAGTMVSVAIKDAAFAQFSQYPAWTQLASWTTDGSTTPLTVLADRLVPGHTYWVRAGVNEGGGRAGALSAFGIPGADVTPPPPPAGVVAVNGYGRLTVTPPAVEDIDHVAVCRTPPDTSSPDPDHCGVWRSTQASASYPPTPITFNVEVLGDYDPGVPNTFRVWIVDKQGNVSAPYDLTVPGAAESATDPGPVPGVVWRSETYGGKVRVFIGFRERVSAAASAAGDQPPARPLPGGGAWSDNTFASDTVYAPGEQVTFGLYRWSPDFSTWTPTYVTVVAGTEAHLGASVSGPTSAVAGQSLVVTGKVSRLVGSATTGMAQASIPVELWSRTAPSTTWVKVAGATTGSSGGVAFTRPALTATTAYQLRVPAQSIYFPAVTTSTTITVTLKPVVVASLGSTSPVLAKSVRKGATVTITTRSNPARTTTLKIQRKVSGTWTTIATKTSSSTGKLSWSWKPTSTGTSYWRVLSVATSKQASGTSSTLTIKST